jgi:CBS domain-containing protein
MTPPALDLTVRAHIGAHAPFDRLEPEAFATMVAQLSLSYHPRDSVILGPAAGPVETLSIVQRGKVMGVASDGREVLVLLAGEAFPIGALVGRRATTLTYRAASDTFLYRLPATAFECLMDTSPVFRNFALRRLAEMISRSHERLINDYGQRARRELSMTAPLAAAVKRPAVTCGVDSPVRSVLETLQRERIGSIAVVDGEGRPLGIFTQSDVIGRITLPGLDLATPISRIMSTPAITLPQQASLGEAATVMAKRRIRHVLVTSDGRVSAVISERDLFALQRASLQSTLKEIARAQDLATLVRLAGEAGEVAHAMLAQGVAAEPLTQFVTSLNDALVERAHALVAACHDLDGIRSCWLGLGSEGRMEQTFATDQDNALVFSAASDVEAVRERLLRFARALNHALAELGFPLCTGGIMAMNRQWCLTLDEWLARFADWTANTDPEAVMAASIFFDFRPLVGDRTLAQALRAAVSDSARRPAFLRLMAANALATAPPLGLFGGITTGEGGRIDLKKQAARLFVDVARLFALARGSPETGTTARLHASGLPVEEAESAAAAFGFIQLLRLRRQHAGDPPNQVVVEQLHTLDQRILKESLRQARKLQERLRLDYQL